MQKMTSAIANKMLRGLEDEKSYWLDKEACSKTYVAATDEEPVIPDYITQRFLRPSRRSMRRSPSSSMY